MLVAIRSRKLKINVKFDLHRPNGSPDLMASTSEGRLVEFSALFS